MILMTPMRFQLVMCQIVCSEKTGKRKIYALEAFKSTNLHIRLDSKPKNPFYHILDLPVP